MARHGTNPPEANRKTREKVQLRSALARSLRHPGKKAERSFRDPKVREMLGVATAAPDRSQP